MPRLLAPLALAFALAALAGCSSEPRVAAVSGTLLKGGKAYNPVTKPGAPTPPGDPGMRLVFTGLDGEAMNVPYSANYDLGSGVFTVPGPTGKGIPAGKYRVAVYVGALGLPGAPKTGGGAVGVPPGGKPAEPDRADTSGLFGKPTYTTEVTVPEAGIRDLVIEMDKK